MAGQSGQKFIKENRAPRVQLEYDLETYDGKVKVELPFVTAVMADLSGKNNSELGGLKDRKFVEIDADGIDGLMKSAKPRVSFRVDNTLQEDGSPIPVDITFESMDDFSPAKVAEKVEPLRKMLTARTQLANLLTYMDGKEDAEKLLDGIMKDENLLQALAAAPKPEDDADKAAE